MSKMNTDVKTTHERVANIIPSNWLDCPRKSSIIAGKFIAFKTPLDDRYKNNIPITQRWTCDLLIRHVKDYHKNLGLIIDLTNTDRYYRSDVEFINQDICYKKIPCEGHNRPPTKEQIDRFIEICDDFLKKKPDELIGVHCTHGFNRTGFLICTYLCIKGCSLTRAIERFAEARPPGVYKQDYLDQLIQLFAKADSISFPAPPRPEWYTETEVVTIKDRKQKYNGPDQRSSNKRFRADINKNSNASFAVKLDDVQPIVAQSLLVEIHSKFQRICNWNRQSFPGSQPVSLDKTNYETILTSDYMVSWKADGTRYMMLISNKNEIFMLDRSNDVFQVKQLSFPKDSKGTTHLKDTIIDGEFVIDDFKGAQIYRYLIYDVVAYDGEYVGDRSFKERLGIIKHGITDIRNQAIANGFIDKSCESFSIRNKEFWDLPLVEHLLSPGFQSQITHGTDGLIFQPVLDPYKPGRADRVFKWKENNTIDFRLKISNTGSANEKEAHLYVNGKSDSYAKMRYSVELEQYNNQIIECSYRNDEWYFYRHRIDKTFPNALATADGVVRALQYPLTQQYLCFVIQESIDASNFFVQSAKE